MLSIIALNGAGYRMHQGPGRTGFHKKSYSGWLGEQLVTGYHFDDPMGCIVALSGHYRARLSAVDMTICPDCGGSSADQEFGQPCPTCRRTGVINLPI